MGIYDKEVSEKLGKEAVEEILKDAQSGHISPQQMDDVAKALEPPEILGNHKRRGNSGADEMREILSDWCQLSDSFHDMSGKDALCLLIRVFKEAPVSLKPLAYRLEKLLTKSKEYLELQNFNFFFAPPLLMVLNSYVKIPFTQVPQLRPHRVREMTLIDTNKDQHHVTIM